MSWPALRRALLAIGLALIALAAIDIGSWAIFPCMGKQIGEGSAGNDDQQQSAYIRCAYNGGVIAAGLRLAGSWGPEAWTASATLILALVTGGLAVATFASVSLTRENIRLARAEFIATHRPKLILREAFSLISDPEESRIMVMYVIANVGASDCWMTEANIGLDFMRAQGYPAFMLTADRSFPSNVPYIGRIKAGEHKRLAFIDPDQVWDHQRRQNYVGELGLHFVGRIAYIDSPGSSVSRQMAFRRKYNPLDQRFHRIWEGENEHEYAD